MELGEENNVSFMRTPNDVLPLILFVGGQLGPLCAAILPLPMGASSLVVSTGAEAVDVLERQDVAIVVVDLRDESEVDPILLQRAGELQRDVEMILLLERDPARMLPHLAGRTPHCTVLRHPWTERELSDAISRGFQTGVGHLIPTGRPARPQVSQRHGGGRGAGTREESTHQILGESVAIREVREKVARFGPTGLTVLITGETGTGKELVSRGLHAASVRARLPFEVLDCSTLSEGLIESDFFGHVKGAFTGADGERRGRFESAHGGTLFIDEIGELPVASQAKLLRILETGDLIPVGGNRSRRVDVRVVAATNRDLAIEVDAGRFRRDLFHRVSVTQIHIPPLRERPEDIALIALSFVGRLPSRAGLAVCRISDAALDHLTHQPLLGNVRELENRLVRGAALAHPGGEIQLEHVREAGDASFEPREGGTTLRHRRDVFDRSVLRDQLRRHGGRRRLVANELGLSERGLNKLIQRLGIDKTRRSN